jgi:predicted PurR-regulated permease PerM
MSSFFLFRQEYILLPALLLTLVDFLPLLGAGVALLPWAGFCFLSGTPQRGVELLILWGAVSLFRRVAEPRLVGKQTGLPPILTLVGI